MDGAGARSAVRGPRSGEDGRRWRGVEDEDEGEDEGRDAWVVRMTAFPGIVPAWQGFLASESQGPHRC